MRPDRDGDPWPWFCQRCILGSVADSLRHKTDIPILISAPASNDHEHLLTRMFDFVVRRALALEYMATAATLKRTAR